MNTNAAYMVRKGWTKKTLGKQCGVIQVRWEKDSITATETLALEIQRGEDERAEGKK